MAYATTIAAIKTAIDDAYDAACVANGNKTLTVQQLEKVLQETISTLHAAGTICGVMAKAD